MIRNARDEDLTGAVAVFRQTASVSCFPDPAARDEFYFKYFGYYWENARELFCVATDEEGVAGYICGVADTRVHRNLYPISPHVPLFDDLYDEYPAHLHINVHERTRGRGVGAMLIQVLEAALRSSEAHPVRGLHLVTEPTARNVSFYLRNGFTHTVERALVPEIHGYRLLFMGKKLNLTGDCTAVYRQPGDPTEFRYAAF